jgi:hypothetical protein
MWMKAKTLEIEEDKRNILQKLVRAPSTPQGIVMRCNIVLFSGDGLANNAIAKKLDVYTGIGKLDRRESPHLVDYKTYGSDTKNILERV